MAALAAAVLGFGWLVAGAEGVLAQQQDEIFVGPRAGDCLEDPSSERCICAAVEEVAWVPKDNHGANRLVGRDVDGVDGPPTFNLATGLWEGTKDYERDGYAPNQGDLWLKKNDLYDEQCALAYLREDLRRSWRFAIALGTLLLGGSLAWIGFVYMQESAQIGSSNGGWSGTRTLLSRVLLGILVLALAGVIWDLMSSMTWPGLQSWTLRREEFYFFER